MTELTPNEAKEQIDSLVLNEGASTKIADSFPELSSSAEAAGLVFSDDSVIAEQSANVQSAIRGGDISPADAFHAHNDLTMNINARRLAGTEVGGVEIPDDFDARTAKEPSDPQHEAYKALMGQKEHLFGNGTKSYLANRVQEQINAGASDFPVAEATPMSADEAIAAVDSHLESNKSVLNDPAAARAAADLLLQHGSDEVKAHLEGKNYDPAKEAEFLDSVANATRQFQTEHNAANPRDTIAIDGAYGMQTHDRIKAISSGATPAPATPVVTATPAPATPAPGTELTPEQGIQALYAALSDGNKTNLAGFMELTSVPDPLPANMNEIVNGMVYEMGHDTAPTSNIYDDGGSWPVEDGTKRIIADLITNNQDRFPGAVAEKDARRIGPKTVAAVATLWAEMQRDGGARSGSYMRS